MAYILFDTETTGTTDSDRICQIAIGILGEPTEYICEYCDPQTPISFHAMSVHGITPDKVAGKPVFENLRSCEILKKFNTPDNVIIAHNAQFDINMINKEGINWGGKVIDTLRCAKHLLPDEESHALQYLRYSLSIYREEGCEEEKYLRATYDTFSAHDTLFDIYILKKLFKRLYPMAGSIQKLIELTNTPVLVKKIKFGKYKGLSMEEIYQKDKNYLNWLSKNCEDEDIIYTIKTFLSH